MHCTSAPHSKKTIFFLPFSNRPRAKVFVQFLERAADGTGGRAVAAETSDRPRVKHSRPSSADARVYDTPFRTQKSWQVVGKCD